MNTFLKRRRTQMSNSSLPRVALIGERACGKTSFLARLQGAEMPRYIPSEEISSMTITHNGISFQVFDAPAGVIPEADLYIQWHSLNPLPSPEEKTIYVWGKSDLRDNLTVPIGYTPYSSRTLYNFDKLLTDICMRIALE